VSVDLKGACQRVNASEFKVALEVVLAIGNYLNANTPRGAVYGFKLSDLTKMMEVKSTKVPLNFLSMILEFLFTLAYQFS